MNTDELIHQIIRDELHDSKLLGFSDFARVLGCSPQQVHYYVRSKTFEEDVHWRICDCGRRVIIVEAALKSLGKATD